MLVFVSAYIAPQTNNYYVEMMCDASNPPTTVVAKGAMYTAGSYIYSQMTATIVVLPNYYYKLTKTGGTPTITLWTEWY